MATKGKRGGGGISDSRYEEYTGRKEDKKKEKEKEESRLCPGENWRGEKGGKGVWPLNL